MAAHDAQDAVKEQCCAAKGVSHTALQCGMFCSYIQQNGMPAGIQLDVQLTLTGCKIAPRATP
jgi:hypothetical protein